MKTLRVIQAYTGEIARHQIRMVASCPWLQLVGAYVFHDDKVGQDAGTIAGIEPLGVTASNRLEDMLALEADVVLYNPPLERYDEIIALLASGKNVISIMAGWNPKALDCYQDLLEACERGNSSLYGTGLNPGLSYELALMASSACAEVESVYIKTCEPQASLSEVFLTHFGFGRSEEQLRSEADQTYAIFHNLMDITDLIADQLSLSRDGRDFSIEFEPATQDYHGKIDVATGTMAGLLVKAASTWQGEPVATIELRFLLGDDYVSEAFLAGRPRCGWIEVDVRGTPGSRIWHELVMDDDVVGTWSTGTRALNAIPAVVAAPAGIRCASELPLARHLPLV